MMAWAEVRRIANNEGPEGQWMLGQIDITADYNRGSKGDLLLSVQYGRETIWKSSIPLTQSLVEQSSMTDAKLEETISTHMRKQLSLVAQLHHARLDKLFPNAIKEVKMGWDAHKAEKTIAVHFKNGHVAEAPEHESKTDLFTARCTMLYDLPPR